MIILYAGGFRYTTGKKYKNGDDRLSPGFGDLLSLYKHKAFTEGKQLSEYKFRQCVILNSHEPESKPRKTKGKKKGPSPNKGKTYARHRPYNPKSSENLMKGPHDKRHKQGFKKNQFTKIEV